MSTRSRCLPVFSKRLGLLVIHLSSPSFPPSYPFRHSSAFLAAPCMPCDQHHRADKPSCEPPSSHQHSKNKTQTMTYLQKRQKQTLIWQLPTPRTLPSPLLAVSGKCTDSFLIARLAVLSVRAGQWSHQWTDDRNNTTDIWADERSMAQIS